jgi:hypothetical protein
MAFKTNQSKGLHLKKAGRKLFPPKADGPEAGRSIGKARVFCILFGPPSEEKSMNLGNRQSIGRKDFVR